MNSPLNGKINNAKYTDAIIKILKATNIVNLGIPEIDFNYLVLQNGVLNLKTKNFGPYTPDIFCFSFEKFSAVVLPRGDSSNMIRLFLHNPFMLRFLIRMRLLLITIGINTPNLSNCLSFLSAMPY